LPVHHVLGLETVEPANSTFLEVAGPAHVGAVHAARKTAPATAPDGEDGQVTRLNTGHRAPDLDYLSEHLVADDQFIGAFGCIGAPTARLLPVGAADPDTKHAHLDLVRCGDDRFRALDHANVGCARGN